MERSERVRSKATNALLIAIRAALVQHEAGVWTALPAFVNKFDASKLTVEAQPTIQAQVRQPDGTWIDTTLPLCQDCPVMFPGGGGFTLTFPLAAGDEGILVFASRCIDAWWQSGGVQKQAELRMHDLSDGFFFPAMLSQPNIPPNVSTDTCQLRSKDGETYIELAGGNIVNIVAPGGITITTPQLKLLGNLWLEGDVLGDTGLTYPGDLKIGGNVVAGFGTVDSVGLKTHTHTSELAGSQTSSPTAGS